LTLAHSGWQQDPGQVDMGNMGGGGDGGGGVGWQEYPRSLALQKPAAMIAAGFFTGISGESRALTDTKEIGFGDSQGWKMPTNMCASPLCLEKRSPH
jgi:hypothetical protein